MENQSKKSTQNIILIFIAIGTWAIVLQNAGIIPTKQNVKVVNTIDANVSGRVNVSGSVGIDNTVDINIEAVNGHKNAFYGPSRNGNYDALHVYTGE